MDQLIEKYKQLLGGVQRNLSGLHQTLTTPRPNQRGLIGTPTRQLLSNVANTRVVSNGPTIGEAFNRSKQQAYLPRAMTQQGFLGGIEPLEKNISRPLGFAANQTLRFVSGGLFDPKMPEPTTIQDKIGMGIGTVTGFIGSVPTIGGVLGKVGTGGEKLVGSALAGRVAGPALTGAKVLGGELAQTGAFLGANKALGRDFDAGTDLAFGLGLRGAFGATGKMLPSIFKSIKDVSPLANKIHKDDLAVMHEWLDMHRANPEAEITGEMGKSAQRLIDHYFGKKWSNIKPKQVAELFNWALDLNAHIPRDVRAPLPRLDLGADTPLGQGTLRSSALTDSPRSGQAQVAEAGMPQAKNTMKNTTLYRGIEPGGTKRYGYEYFTMDKDYAKKYAGDTGDIVEATLNIKNPLRIEAKKGGYGEITVDGKIIGFYRDLKPEAVEILRSKGYDGIIADFDGKKNFEVVPFDTAQINVTKDALGYSRMIGNVAQERITDTADDLPPFSMGFVGGGGRNNPVDDYVRDQVKKQQAAAGGEGLLSKLKKIKTEIKRKFVDETTAISDVLTRAEKQAKFQVLPKNDIRFQIDRALRSDTLATQFAKDNGLTDVIQNVDDLDRFNQYLIAKQALRVGEKGIATGRDLNADRQLVGALETAYEPFAGQIRAYNDALLQYKVDSGFITADLADALRQEYPDYVPLQRVFSELEQAAMHQKSGKGGVASIGTQDVLKRLKGSEREIVNPLESILENTAVAFRQGERNRAAQMLASYMGIPGNPFGIVPLRTAENVEKRISLYSDAKELKPLQDTIDRMISSEGRQLRKLEAEVRRLNIKGLTTALKQEKVTPAPTTSMRKVKRVSSTGKPLYTRVTRYPSPKRLIEGLISLPSTELERIKRSISLRDSKSAALLDDISLLKTQFEGVRSTRRQLIGQARELKDGSKFAKHTFSSWKNGIREDYEALPEVVEAAKNLNPVQLGILGQLFSVPTRVLRLGAVGVNVPFVASNIIRDQVFAAITSNKATRTSLLNPVNFLKAFYTVMRRGELYDEWVRSGSSFTQFDIGRNATPVTINKVRAGRNVASRVAYTATHPGELLTAVENIIGRAEEVTRVQQFRGTRQALQGQGRTAQDAALLAADASRSNTANFARKGAWGKVLNTVIPFFNTGIQGSRSLVRSFQRNPVGTTVRFTTTVAIPTTIVTAWNLSDPARQAAYEDIPDYEKDGNLILLPPVPEQDEDGNWKAIKIPVTPGLSNLMSIVRRGVEGVHGMDPGSATQIVTDLIAAGTSINLGEPNKLLSQTTPQLIKPGLEGFLNKNLYTGRDIVPSYMKDRLPEEQAYDTTSGTARLIGGATNTSPIMVEHLIGTTAAGVGRQGLNASDRVLAGAGVIPEDQIGGRSIGEDFTTRFSRARGGEIEQKREQTENQARVAALRTGTPQQAGNILYYREDDQAKKLDLSPVGAIELSGNAVLDKEIYSDYSGVLTSKKNAIVKLYELGRIDAETAAKGIEAIEAIRASAKLKATGKGTGTGRGRKAKAIKISVPKSRKASAGGKPRLKIIDREYKLTPIKLSGTKPKKLKRIA